MISETKIQELKEEYDKLEKTYLNTYKNFNRQNNRILALKKKYEKQLKLYRKIVKEIEDDAYHKEDVRYYHGNIYGVKEILEDLEELLK